MIWGKKKKEEKKKSEERHRQKKSFGKVKKGKGREPERERDAGGVERPEPTQESHSV